MHLVRTARPTATCITAATVKSNQRVSHASEDPLINGWIKAAEDLVERRTNRAIMRQTYRLVLPIVRPTVTLFRPPMEGEISLVSAKVTVGGFDTVLAHADAVLGLNAMLPTVSFGEITEIDSGTMDIVYETGATTADEVPPGIQHAVLLLASHYYKSREAAYTDQRITGNEKTLPYGAEAFIGAYRIPNVNIAVNEAA